LSSQSRRAESQDQRARGGEAKERVALGQSTRKNLTSSIKDGTKVFFPSYTAIVTYHDRHSHETKREGKADKASVHEGEDKKRETWC